MPNPGEIFDSAALPNGTKPLPLFRPEALAHQQEKSYGQIILIRPLPLMVLTWLAFVVVAAAGGLLIFGHYTEKARIAGVVSTNANTGPAGSSPQAELYVPARWLALVQPGRHLALHCPECSPQYREQPATVLGISDAPVNFPDVSASGVRHGEQKYKITVLLPPQAAQISGVKPPQAGLRVETQIPLGSKPLIKWFFERSGS